VHIYYVYEPKNSGDTRPTRLYPLEDIARVGRKDVGVSGEPVSMSVSWNAAFIALDERPSSSGREMT